MNFKGILIEESLEDKSILKTLTILGTTIEKVTTENNTPWLKKWTLHAIEVTENHAMLTAEKISRALDKNHPWYADYKNDEYHFIIFKKKIFVVDLKKKEEYGEVKKYGLSQGIAESQLDF